MIACPTPQDIERWTASDYAAAVRRLLSLPGLDPRAGCPDGAGPDRCGDVGRVRRVVLRKLLNNLGVLAARQVGCACPPAPWVLFSCQSSVCWCILLSAAACLCALGRASTETRSLSVVCLGMRSIAFNRLLVDLLNRAPLSPAFGRLWMYSL